jgi:PAS domain S-box-containing protein
VSFSKSPIKRTPLPPRTRLALVWIALIPVLLTFVAVWLNRQFRNEIAWVQDAYRVRSAVREIVFSVWDADRDMRNYLLTGQETYRNGMQTAAVSAQQSLKTLQGLIADNPFQVRNFAQLHSLVKARLVDQQRTLNRYEAGGLGTALNPAEIGLTARSMQEIWNLSDSMLREEERVLVARTQWENSTNLKAEAVFACAILLTLALLFWAVRLLQENAAKRDQAEQQLQQKVREIESLNQDLEQRVEQRTAELQQSNLELARSNEANRLLASVVESSDDAIIANSANGVIESWNSGAERLYGYKAEEIVSHDIRELLPPDRPDEETEILARLRRGEQVEHFETVRLRKGGTPVEVSLTISPIRDESKQIIGASHISRDITQQKQTEEAMRQAQKLESLGVLAGGVAHDFNNLLVGIIGNASLALENIRADSPASRQIQGVIAAGERAAALTRQMLAYSGKGRFVIDRIDLSAYVREMIPLIEAAIPRTIELRLVLGEALPAIEADSTQIQQLIMNLVINGAEAIQSGDPGSVTIVTRSEQINEDVLRTPTIAQTTDLKPGLYVVLEVRDTGSGMDEATKSRIFDPFFTTKFTGRGLGLAAVLGIVRGHGGIIRVSTSCGHGTTFQVLFPALAVGVNRRSASPTGMRDLSGGGSVLVVDDEPIVRKVAKQALEHYGYRVLLAEDGQRAVDIFRREADQIRCVVLDLTMPNMSGEETLRWLKALRPGTPVILSSGFTEAEAVRRFVGKDLAGFIQKPYKAVDIAQKIKDVLAAGNPPLGKTG